MASVAIPENVNDDAVLAEIVGQMKADSGKTPKVRTNPRTWRIGCSACGVGGLSIIRIRHAARQETGLISPRWQG
jgi:hypothetical protein